MRTFSTLFASTNGVVMEVSQPGKLTNPAWIESFQGTIRDKCLNLHWLLSLEEAKEKIETWRQEYHESWPHRALNNLSPNEYAVLKAA